MYYAVIIHNVFYSDHRYLMPQKMVKQHYRAREKGKYKKQGESTNIP
uniref:Uncharacterized protein n=1 Tax=Arundo donax TaxID=35708 RepID=A0A0A9GWH7_ARUDO